MSRALASSSLHVGLLAVLSATATALAGWWLLPVVAAAWVRVFPRTPAPGATSAIGAASGWALLLVWNAARGPAGTVARRVGGVFLLPGWAFVAVTLLFAALLAGTAAIAASRTHRR